ncbi:hypothetical protein OJ253_2382 [Cryptosporidium canis]|uniref:Uncharacterized protein n=1 Tax=Cryptosporidium canis TaxID=195482 RepID=A0A9D5DKK6_9CRYT|nr:hypothetical protein OJ253_2382 [Cryptosporidium canis]
MSPVNKQKYLAFELYYCLYNDGGEFISNEWFIGSVGSKYSKLVFTIISFLNGRIDQESLKDFQLEKNISEIYDIYKSGAYSIYSSNDKLLSDLFFRLKSFFENNINSSSIDQSELVSIVNFPQPHEKYVACLIFWVAIRFFGIINTIKDGLVFDKTVSNCLNLAYNIDQAIWDPIVSDYILLVREKGAIEINSIFIELNEDIESLFFLYINPYNICPILCCLLLMLKSKSSRMSFIKTKKFVQSIIYCIIQLIKNTLREISPDMAEVSFTISVCRMIANISDDINNELINQLFLLKNSQKTKRPTSENMNPSFIDRFILYSFVSMEQLWLEIYKDEHFLSSIISYIPTLELSISILSLVDPDKEFTKYISLLVIIFSLDNQISITGTVNASVIEIMRKLVATPNNQIETILKCLLFPNDPKDSSSELNMSLIFNFLSDSLCNVSVSYNLVKSIANLIQINYMSLTDTFLHNYLEPFPKLVKYLSTNTATEKVDVKKKINLLTCINSFGCLLIDEMYWLNSNLVQYLFTLIDIEFEHILPFLYSISLSVTNIQSIINNQPLHKCRYFNVEDLRASDQEIFKSRINGSNISNSINFLLKTKNIDMIIISILDYLIDWIKRSGRFISIECLLKKSSSFNSVTNHEYSNGYFAIFLIYIFSRTIETDKLDGGKITTNFHSIPWRSALKWIESWERVFPKSALNPRTWKIIFSEVIAIVIPESLIIPFVPNGSFKTQNQGFSLDVAHKYKENVMFWLKDRKIYLESCQGEISFEDVQSTLRWLEMFYLEPIMTVYFTLECIFIQESAYVSEFNFQEFYFEICSSETKLKDFVSSPDVYIKNVYSYLPDEKSVEIICNISLVMLYFHEVIRHKNPIITHFQSADFEVFCIIWNKYVNYCQIENQLTKRQFLIFFSNIFCRNSNIIKQMVEQGFQYKHIINYIDIDIYLEKTRFFMDAICHGIPQILHEQNILPKIANKLDKLLNTRSLIEMWGKYDVTNNNGFGTDPHIENQLIQCVSLLSWLSNIITVPTRSMYNISEDSPIEKASFLPVAERSVVRVLCITQDIINSQLDGQAHCYLISNFNILLKHSTHFIISVANSFPQLSKALKDTLVALKQLMSDSPLSDSSIHHTINIIYELL